jgi:predicted negative regulator of RcsB-dependent stress response
MAHQLDLEEQEQLDELKHFWSRYGNLITWILIAVLGSLAAWNGYAYWRKNQAAQSAVMFDEMEKSLQSADLSKVERTFNDMKERFPASTYTQQAALQLAKMSADTQKTDTAKAALQWAADNASDEGYASVARLRLASLHMETKALESALKVLEDVKSPAFKALVDDRKGDIWMLEGKKTEAKAAYLQAFSALEERSEYRRLIRVKLNALGIEPEASTADGAKKSADGDR